MCLESKHMEILTILYAEHIKHIHKLNFFTEKS